MKCFCYIIILFIGVVLMSCSTFAGILFPKIHFSITPVGIQPPSNANERLKAGGIYSQTFSFLFSQAGNSFTTSFIPTIFVNKPYETLFIKEMKYEYDGKSGLLIDNKSYNITIDNYITSNDWYWICGIGEFLKVNFEKIFINKKHGDKFTFKLTLVYSFDDTAEQTQVLEYNVIATKGTYTSLFMGR